VRYSWRVRDEAENAPQQHNIMVNLWFFLHTWRVSNFQLVKDRDLHLQATSLDGFCNAHFFLSSTYVEMYHTSTILFDYM
jgi:hypothetical protein